MKVKLVTTAEAVETPFTDARVLRPRRAAPADAVRPTRAEINLGNLRHNLRVLERAASGSRIYGVLKADGYGHGAPAVARTLERAGIDGFCVALLEEAVELREAGIRVPIIAMGGYYGQAWGEVIARDVTPVIYDVAHAEALAREVRFANRPTKGPVPVHFKVDTGMARLGATLRDLGSVLDRVRAIEEVSVEGLMTHLACADEPGTDAVTEQLDRFDEAARIAGAHGARISVRHAASSAAVFRTPRAQYDIVRPGLALYGVTPNECNVTDLRPVMKVRTEIVSLRTLAAGEPVGYNWTWRAGRESRIATVPIGYADGLSRHLSNRGHVLVRGKRAPIVGTVSMDLTMIDVTDCLGTSVRDEVVVLGPQQGPLGSDTIGSEEIARLTGTISYDVLTSVSRRVPRFYREP
jgi:alanine racemase